MEVGLDLVGVAEQIAIEMVVGIAFLGLQGEGETGVGVFAHGFFGAVALFFEVIDDFLEEHFLNANFDLLGPQDAPGMGGELVGEEFLVGVLGGEVGFEAVF